VSAILTRDISTRLVIVANRGTCKDAIAIPNTTQEAAETFQRADP